MSDKKTIGVVFIEQFADWEFGYLTGSVPEWFEGRVVTITPDGAPVRSFGGLAMTPERSADPADNIDLDAVAVIGSDVWSGPTPPDVGPLLAAVAERGGIVGGICAGTLALARAGLFSNARHTSNGRDWLDYFKIHYAGEENYQESPRAVTDCNIITAPGSAPGTFATAFLTALYPEKAEQTAHMKAMFAREYS